MSYSVRTCLLSRILACGSRSQGRPSNWHVNSTNWTALRATSTSSASSSSATVAVDLTTSPPPRGGRRDRLDLTFNDAEAAFKSKSTGQILRAYLVFTLCSSNYLVDHNMQVKLSLGHFFSPSIISLCSISILSNNQRLVNGNS